mmetsp:Transcript_6101/g.10605  ORF Transcript_6101/g.10605 Transcript_6101/m.10605 type:complete len:340 (+) Transcript_6101:99-1118(+)
MPLQQRALRGWGTRGASSSSTFALSNSREQDVEVEVVHVRDKFSVSVTVPSKATIEQVKQILVSDMGEGNSEDVRFFLYSGTTAELMDSEKLGTRRKLYGDGFGCDQSETESSLEAKLEEQEVPPLDDAKEESALLPSSDIGLADDVEEKSEEETKVPTPDPEIISVEQTITFLDAIKQVGADSAFAMKVDALYQRGGITLKLGLTQLTAQVVQQASVNSCIGADLEKIKQMVKDNKDNAIIVEKASDVELMLRLAPGSLFGVVPEKKESIPPTTKSPPMQKRSTISPRHVAYEESAIAKEIPVVDVMKNGKEDYDNMLDRLQSLEDPTHFALEPLKIH